MRTTKTKRTTSGHQLVLSAQSEQHNGQHDEPRLNAANAYHWRSYHRYLSSESGDNNGILNDSTRGKQFIPGTLVAGERSISKQYGNKGTAVGV